MTSAVASVNEQQSFATWLLQELVRREIQPADLARALKTRGSTVSSWTNPRKPVSPSPYYATAIAQYLEIPSEDVLRRAGHLPEEEVGLKRNTPGVTRRPTAIDDTLREEILAEFREAAERVIRRLDEREKTA